VYWLDADAFIQASARTGPYPFKRAPGFWSFLSAQIEAGQIRSPKIVYDELTRGNDELAQWCKQRREKGLCVGANKAVHDYYTAIANHVIKKYGQRKASEFLRGGDGWVIAHAMETGPNGIVVTQESTRHSNAKVKVPTVCKEFGVPCISTFQMLDDFEFTFAEWS
jgi:hypothetical protein